MENTDDKLQDMYDREQEYFKRQIELRNLMIQKLIIILLKVAENNDK